MRENHRTSTATATTPTKREPKCKLNTGSAGNTDNTGRENNEANHAEQKHPARANVRGREGTTHAASQQRQGREGSGATSEEDTNDE